MRTLCTLWERFRRFDGELTARDTAAHIVRMKPPRRLICGKPLPASRAIAKHEPSLAEMEAAHRQAMSFLSDREDEWRDRHKGKRVIH
jgi:hypothetical protein